MFAKVNVPILGVIENMSWFECNRGTRYPIFGEGGGKREAKRIKVPLLAEIPINPATCEKSDDGTPIALLSNDTAYHAAATKLTKQLKF